LVPPSKRVEYHIEATAAKLGLSKATVEEALALNRRLERKTLFSALLVLILRVVQYLN